MFVLNNNINTAIQYMSYMFVLNNNINTAIQYMSYMFVLNNNINTAIQYMSYEISHACLIKHCNAFENVRNSKLCMKYQRRALQCYQSWLKFLNTFKKVGQPFSPKLCWPTCWLVAQTAPTSWPTCWATGWRSLS